MHFVENKYSIGFVGVRKPFMQYGHSNTYSNLNMVNAYASVSTKLQTTSALDTRLHLAYMPVQLVPYHLTLINASNILYGPTLVTVDGGDDLYSPSHCYSATTRACQCVRVKNLCRKPV